MRVVELQSALLEGEVMSSFSSEEIMNLVHNEKRIVVLKNVFPKEMLVDIRRALLRWRSAVSPAAGDDFTGNYHRMRAMVSNIQKAPHVFHDHNFNTIDQLEPDLRTQLFSLFEPLRRLYNSLTSYDVEFGVPQKGPYLHPQVIQYPSGGGFFGRHWHNLHPQKVGFIVSLSARGEDYTNGGTVFEIDGEKVDMEGRHSQGDICLWRYDYPHWVTQSDLSEKFDWGRTDGRWVATLAYFDPAT